MADRIQVDLDMSAIRAALEAAQTEPGTTRRQTDPVDQAIRQWKRDRSRARDLQRMAAEAAPPREPTQMERIDAQIAEFRKDQSRKRAWAQMFPSPPLPEPPQTPEQLQDQRIKAWRQQRSRQRALEQMEQEGRTPGFVQGLMGLRFGAGIAEGGGGFTGMLGTVGQFAGLLGKVNPALLGAAAALGGLVAATMSASKQLMEIGQARLVTGGTSGQVAMGRALAGAVGMDPAGIGGLAHAFRQRIATDPMAMAMAGRFGIQARPRGMGMPQNEMETLLRGIGMLRRARPGAERQDIIERMPELEGFAMLAEASDKSVERIGRMAQAMDKIATPEMLARTMEFNLALQGFHQAFSNLMVTVGGPFINFLTTGMQQILDFLIQIGVVGGGKRTAEEEHADAMRAHSRELRMSREGRFGGGPWAAGAVPAGLRGLALDNALRQQSARLGAF